MDTQRVVTEKGEVTFYSFGAPEAAIERGPRWLEHAACPPLSPWKAQAAALAEAQRMRPSVKKWRTAVISLLPLSPYVQEPGPYHGCWYYAVTFHRADMALGGMPESLTIPVLMSGRAVQGTRIQ